MVVGIATRRDILPGCALPALVLSHQYYESLGLMGEPHVSQPFEVTFGFELQSVHSRQSPSLCSVSGSMGKCPTRFNSVSS